MKVIPARSRRAVAGATLRPLRVVAQGHGRVLTTRKESRMPQAKSELGKDRARREHLSRKGEFRSYYVRMLDEDEFQSFAPETQRAFFFLKGLLGQWGVDVMYPAELAARMRVDLAVVRAALDELTGAGWFRTEKNVCWLVNGLRHEPWYEPGNENQVAGLRKFLRGLPEVPLLTEVVAAYSTAPDPATDGGDEDEGRAVEGCGAAAPDKPLVAEQTAANAPATVPGPPPVKRDPKRDFDPDEDWEHEYVDGRLLTGGEFVRLYGGKEGEDAGEDEELEDDDLEKASCAA